MYLEDTNKRAITLDAFRGAVIAAMILVNNPGTTRAVYSQLRHADWNGSTFADIIFPFFLFIVGLAMVFSFAKRKGAGEERFKLLVHVVNRSIFIFGIGILMNLFPFSPLVVRHIQIPGVLQRIAVCYLIGSLIVIKTTPRTQICCAAGLLLSYWLMMEFFPVPGIGAGSFEPGANLAAYVDEFLLKGHLKYDNWDPQGVFSTIPALATTLFGALAGHWLLSKRSREEKIRWIFIIGPLLIAVGLLWNPWLPINKKIWTSSYSVFTAGWALLCLGVFYWLIEIRGCKRWAEPFAIYGMNSFALYLLSESLSTILRGIEVVQPDGSQMTLKDYIFGHVFMPLASPAVASLLFAVSFDLFLYLIAWFMWRKRWFLKV